MTTGPAGALGRWRLVAPVGRKRGVGRRAAASAAEVTDWPLLFGEAEVWLASTVKMTPPGLSSFLAYSEVRHPLVEN